MTRTVIGKLDYENDAAIREDERKRVVEKLQGRMVPNPHYGSVGWSHDKSIYNSAIGDIIESLRATTPAPGNRDYQCGDNCHGECSGEYDGKIHCPESEPEKEGKP